MGHRTCYYTVKSDLGGSFTYSLTPISIGEFTWVGGPPRSTSPRAPDGLGPALIHCFGDVQSIHVWPRSKPTNTTHIGVTGPLEG